MLILYHSIFLKLQENMFGLPVYVTHSYTFTLLHYSMKLCFRSTSRGKGLKK